jgi:radical SAM protein with 4Fe4S-binding SPASM domain
MAWMKTLEALTKFPEMVLRGRFPFTFDGVPLIAEGLPFRKRMNLLKGGVDMLLRSERCLGLPPTIQIEPTNICNLKCPLCPTGTDTMKRTKGFMSLETFKRILDELGSTLVFVVLYGWGEPFLNKKMPNFIEECTSRNILTFSSTNGHCLQTLDDALRVVDAGLNSLVIAIDGSTQETYTNYRKCGDVEKVKRCAALIEKAKIRRGSKFPYTNLRIVVTRNNIADLPNVERLAHSLGVNMFSYKSVGSLCQTEGFKSYEPGEESMRRYEYKDDTRSARPPIQCPFPFRQPTVFWDGTVVGCEFDYNLQIPWGKIGEHDFGEIWNISQATRLRTSIRNGRDRPEFCSLCPYQDRVQDSCILSARELRPIIDR